MRIASFLRNLFVAALVVPGTALATHEPSLSELVVYDGSAVPGPLGGAIGWANPTDGYDWYCATAESGTEVTISIVRDSGDLLLNTGVLEAIAGPGATFGSIEGELIDHSSNDSDPDVLFSFTPDFSGPFTIWVSTWLDENGGSYTMTVTGATAADCNASVVGAPAYNGWGLLLLVGLLVLVGTLRLRSGAAVS